MRFSFFSLSLVALKVVNAGLIVDLDLDGAKDVIPGSWIVVMNDGVSSEDFESHRSWAAGIVEVNLARIGKRGTGGSRRAFDLHGWRGYIGDFDELSIQEIANRSEVKYVEHDRIVRVSELVTQPNAPSWGLGRVSSRTPGIDNYIYDSTAGEGITIYGVDTGIDIRHPDFERRAVWGSNQVDNDDTDGNGHGTHTASTFAGKDYGVAKKASIVAVKVLDAQGSGSISGIIGGMEWCVNHATENNLLGKAVMNLSLGGPLTRALNEAATSAVNAGIFLAVAAGNDAVDAGGYSPASAQGVCTVAASTEQDAAADFSNFGSVVDVWAPGEDILGAVPGGGRGTFSGTSMASPHVAGVGAYLMALERIAPGAVCDRIKELAIDTIANPGRRTTGKLLFNGVAAGNLTQPIWMRNRFNRN